MYVNSFTYLKRLAQNDITKFFSILKNYINVNIKNTEYGWQYQTKYTTRYYSTLEKMFNDQYHYIYNQLEDNNVLRPFLFDMTRQ